MRLREIGRAQMNAGVDGPPDPDLDVRMEGGVPRRLPSGCSTALFVTGVCFHRRLPIWRLELLAGGIAVDATAHGMPRSDLYYKLNPASAFGDGGRGPGSKSDPARQSYLSGFWADLPIEMPAIGSVELMIRATLSDGSISLAPIGSIAPEPPPIPAEVAGPVPTLVICMATFQPNATLFACQVESIRGQTDLDWVCLISDDRSDDEHYEQIERTLAGDQRFVLSRAPLHLGFYRNFERALGLVPSDVQLVALSDQDDVWYPDKLATLRRELGGAQLVYSDQRVVDTAGNVIASSYWSEARANNYKNLASLLIANTVTGAASLFRRELLDLALPFPAPPGVQYHDQWLALAAASSGGISYVSRPLYDYVQHDDAALGHQGGGRPPTAEMSTLRKLMTAVTDARIAYFEAFCRIRLLAKTILVRAGAGAGVDRSSRRTLNRFARSEGLPFGALWLVARQARYLAGRTETQGAERLILRGLAWRRVAALLGRIRSQPLPGINYDARMSPAVPTALDPAIARIGHPGTRALGTIAAPLELSVSSDAPERINLLIPTIELQHLFGGYITKFNLARKLAEHGLRVRILTVDPTPPLPSGWRQEVEAYAGLAGLFDRVEVEFARDLDAPVEVNPADAFIATTWWTAHIAHAALEPLERSRFLYLIQEFEPYTHAMGSWAAYALSTYELPHTALFSTALLRDFFAARGYGVFVAGEKAGRASSVAFENAITAVSPPSVEEMAARERKRLLFYARPEAHGARNMFELGLLGISEAISRDVFGPEWEFHGIGSVEGRDRRIELPHGRELQLLSKRDQSTYAEVLTTHDAGLALMCTPHPSLVPLEMASAGMLTVTNAFETKTPKAMSALAPNLITKSPSIEGIVAGLREAVAGSDDFERRIAGATVEWSRDWEQSFNDELIGQIVTLLEIE